MTVLETLEHPIDAAEGKGSEPAGGEGERKEGAGEGGERSAAAKPPAAGKGGKDKKRDMILIVVGIVGLILTFIIYERSKSTAATTAAATTPGTGTQTDGSSGSSEPEADSIASALNSYEQSAQAAYQQLANQETSDAAASASAQSGLQASIASLQGTIGNLEAGGSNATGNGTAPAGGDSSGPPSLSASLMAQLTGNGEFITDVVQDAQGGYLYLTNKGGVYNEGGSPNYGSYLGLTAAQRNQTSQFTSITPNPGGGYTETDAQGASYTFNQGTASQGVGLG